jgi:SAM-dependent methyltransferase
MAVRKARGYNQWIYRQIKPYLGRRILEAGCGIGSLTEQLLHSESLVAADTEPLYVELTRRRFGHLENFRALQVDWTSESDCARIPDESLDSVFCINVLEHVDNDVAVLRRFHRMLIPGGRIITIVPQHRWLFTSVDSALGHKRRYSASDIRRKLTDAGFAAVQTFGFNKLGSLAWWMSGKVFRTKRFTPQQFNLYNLMLPVAKLVERVPFLPANSAVAVAEKVTRKSGTA